MIMATIIKLPETTIQMISAGEIITKPVNVVKELIENSLDAGATNIRITIEHGGMKLIEIIDNGHGIAKTNAEMLCHRHTTSKLSCADDLSRIATFGFRGEALASISEMADIEIRSFNIEHDKMGWQANYRHGELNGCATDKYLQNSGTQLRVLNLFSGIYNRKQAMLGSMVDEKKSIVELVTRYAIHHRNKVTMSLKDDNSADLICLLAPISIKPCIGMFFGMDMEINLLEVQGSCSNQCSANYNIIFSSRKTSTHHIPVFILFVNNRLVHCNELKKELMALANEFSLNSKQTTCFFYISLQVPSYDVDVNTHPAKETVKLHYQEEIISSIVAALRERFQVKFQLNKSIGPTTAQQRTISDYINASPNISPSIMAKTPVVINFKNLGLLAPGCLDPQSPRSPGISLLSTPQKKPYDLIHNDSSQQTLAQLTGANKTRPKARIKRGRTEPIEPWPGIENIGCNTETKKSPKMRLPPKSKSPDHNQQVEVITIGDNSDVSPPSDAHGECASSTEVEKSDVEDGGVIKNEVKMFESSIPMPPQRSRRDLKLKSIHDLRKQVAREGAKNNAKTIKNSVFVGLFDHDRALIQHETRLFAISLKAYLKEQYYQFYLFDFGNFPSIEILPPGNKLKFIIDTYLEDIKKYEPAKFQALKFNCSRLIIDKLVARSAMFEDYLSLKLNEEEILKIPCIMPDEVPNLAYLGKFLVELANYVDYTEERECLRGIGRVIADFYSEAPANLKDRDVHKAYHDLVETKLYVAIKNYLFIPEWLFSMENICQISDTRDLYKVFERC